MRLDQAQLPTSQHLQTRLEFVVNQQVAKDWLKRSAIVSCHTTKLKFAWNTSTRREGLCQVDPCIRVNCFKLTIGLQLIDLGSENKIVLAEATDRVSRKHNFQMTIAS